MSMVAYDASSRSIWVYASCDREVGRLPSWGYHHLWIIACVQSFRKEGIKAAVAAGHVPCELSSPAFGAFKRRLTRTGGSRNARSDGAETLPSTEVRLLLGEWAFGRSTNPTPGSLDWGFEPHLVLYVVI